MTKEPKPRISWQSRIKKDMQTFHAKTGMKLTTIGAKAVKNARIWDRLNNGGTITLEIADEIYEFMATEGHHFNS